MPVTAGKSNNMSKLSEACDTLQKAVDGTDIELNFSHDQGVSIHWHGVIRLDCTPAEAAKAIPLFKQLNALGAADC